MEPTASRPDFPGYGLREDDEGLLPWTWATERLAESRNYWICTASADGAPHARPVWGVFVEDGVCFGTKPDSVKGRHLARDPRLQVHLESGDEVVILHGRVELAPAELSEAIDAEYQRKYDFSPLEDGIKGWYRVRPERGYAWRERDFPHTATRFDF